MEKVDVLIVGGGIAGASLGARLAGTMSVMLIEAEDFCGRHATGRSAAFWQASLGGETPERRLSLLSKPMFDENWPGSETPLLRSRGAVHLTGPCGESMDDVGDLAGEHAPVHLDRQQLDRLIPGLREQWTGAWYEASCSDIEVASFHASCLSVVRRHGQVRTDVSLLSARHEGQYWQVQTSAGEIGAGILVNAAGAWGDQVAERAGIAGLGRSRGDARSSS